MTCVYKKYEIKMVQEQWICLKMKFLLDYNMKIVENRKKAFGPILIILGKTGGTIIAKILKLKVTLLYQSIHWNIVYYFIQKCYGIQQIADFVKSIFSLVLEGGHFLLK